MLNITVIGFGNVGSLLCTCLLNSSHLMKLNILEPNKETEGALLDLEHSIFLYPTKELHINNENILQKADFIFYTAGTPNKHNSSRLSKAKENIELCKEIFEAKSFEKQPYIIVISNPVDVISLAVHKFSGISAEKVIGTGTFLDSIRLSYYLSYLSHFPTKDYESWVLGEHGNSQIPIYTKCKIHGKSLIDNAAFSAEKLDQAAELTKEAANRIRETQTGTKYGVVKCAATIFEYILNGKEKLLPLSVLTSDYYRELLQLERDIYISLPVKLKSGKLEILNGFKMSEKELQALRRSAKILSEASEI